MLENDTLQHFTFENHGVRGEFVRLHKSFLAVLQQQQYPAYAGKLLGEALVAAVLLNAIIKTEGKLTIQIQGDGPINLLLAQCNHANFFRGLAKWQGEILEESYSKALGKGKIVITIDPGATSQQYQAIVAIHGESLAESIQNYFNISEQLPTFIYLAANEDSAVGMFLQATPGSSEKDIGSYWEHLSTIAHTLKQEELLTLPNEEILHRLYHEEEIRLFEAMPVSFRCTCSKENIAVTIKAMGEEEVLQLLKENGMVDVRCEFCNRDYQFDKVDINHLFTHGAMPPSSTEH